MKKVAIIGGGASGMMAAITAAKEGADVTLFEGNERVGKKILMTGNGKCNFSNEIMSENHFFCDDKEKLKIVLSNFGVIKTLDFFGELGVNIKSRNGGFYPATEQASTILDVLRHEISHRKVNLIIDHKVKNVIKMNNKFKIDSINESFDAIILSCGGKAAPNTGSDGTGYTIAKALGHSVIKPVPALVQLKCDKDYWKSISGVRTEANLTLVINNINKVSEMGELQITDYGISGIPVFQFSRIAAEELDKKSKVEVIIDFLPWVAYERIQISLEKRLQNNGYKTAEEFFCGLVHKKIYTLALKLCNIKLNEIADSISIEKLEEVMKLLKGWQVTVKSTNPFANAQVTAGGIPMKELNSTLESIICEGLFFAGEIINVDGRCGGYNLQWAWSSGYTAGLMATRKE